MMLAAKYYVMVAMFVYYSVAAIVGDPAQPEPDFRPVESDEFQIGHATVMFDRRTRTPRWVLERLDQYALIDNADRGDEFFTPHGVPVEFRPSTKDYVGSGYDRGHAAPAADFQYSQAMTDQSFSLANIFPQDPRLNRGMWADLEQDCRDLASNRGVVVYVATVPLWMPAGLPLNADRFPDMVSYRIIGKNHVAVPTHIGKSIVAWTGKSYGMRSYIIPNEKPRKDLRFEHYRVTTDYLEHWAGLDLWSGLDDQFEVKLEKLK